MRGFTSTSVVLARSKEKKELETKKKKKERAWVGSSLSSTRLYSAYHMSASLACTESRHDDVQPLLALHAPTVVRLSELPAARAELGGALATARPSRQVRGLPGPARGAGPLQPGQRARGWCPPRVGWPVAVMGRVSRGPPWPAAPAVVCNLQETRRHGPSRPAGSARVRYSAEV